MRFPSRPLATLLFAAAATAPFVAVAAPVLAQSSPASDAAVRTIEIVVENGYHPARIEIAAGESVRLVFVRREYGPCTREVVFPSLDIRRELPTNERVAIDLPALTPGEHEFRCGMHMIRGKLVVREVTP